MDGDKTLPFTLSNISPPVFTQPLPDTLPEPLEQASADILSQTSPPCFQAEEPTPYDLLTNEYTNSPGYTSPTLSLLTNDLFQNSTPSSNFYNSPTDQPPSSAFPSETSPALVSDSELAPSSQKTNKVTCLTFYQKFQLRNYIQNGGRESEIMRKKTERSMKSGKKRMRRSLTKKLEDVNKIELHRVRGGLRLANSSQRTSKRIPL